MRQVCTVVVMIIELLGTRPIAAQDVAGDNNLKEIKRACEDVQGRLADIQIANAKSNHDIFIPDGYKESLLAQCEETPRGTKYWGCVDRELNQGLEPTAALARCADSDTSPSRRR